MTDLYAENAALRARVEELESRLHEDAARDRAAIHYDDPDAALEWEEAQLADLPGRRAMEGYNEYGEPY